MNGFRVFGLLLIFICSPVMAWWEAGHMMVADIAYMKLTPKAKKEMKKLLRYMDAESTSRDSYQFNEKNPNYTMMAVSHWADDLHTYPNYLTISKTWHYIEHAYSEDGTPFPAIIPRDNVLWAISTFRHHITRPSANNASRARAMSYIIHFVGDLHQPMHTAEYYSQALPHGDRGGNSFSLRYVELNGEVISNLHALWDSALALYPNKGFSHDLKDPQEVDTLAKIIMNDYPESYFGKKANIIDPSLWEQESHQLAVAAHHIPMSQNKEPSKDYIDHYSQVAEQQIALAGYRLAHLINFLLK